MGGFDTAFRGWGLEDTHLAAKLIAAGAYIIPNTRLVAYHVVGRLSRAQKLLRRREFERNLATYRHLRERPLRLWEQSAWESAMRKEIGNRVRLVEYGAQVLS